MNLGYRHSSNLKDKEYLKPVKKKSKQAGSAIGGILIISGLLIVISAPGGDASGIISLLVCCFFGFGLMAIGGATVIKANQK